MSKPMPNPAPQKKNYIPILMAAVGIISLFVILQAFGIFKTFETSSTEGWIDLKSPEYQNRPMPVRRAEKPNPNVEATLQEIASEFEGKVFSNIQTANSQKGWGLTDDEAEYYDRMRLRYANNTSNWLGLVKRSYNTYRNVKEIFGGSADLSALVNDAQYAMTIYNKLQEIYGISTAESKDFALSGQGKNISDWASFVEKMKRK
jgi:hypothetical protein